MKKIILGIFLITTTFFFAQETPKDSVIEPFRIDTKFLSGLDIPKLNLKAHPERKYYQKRIYKGDELSIYFLSSETITNEIQNFPIDEFVYYLNGKAEITTKDSTTLSFYANDYLFVPKGFSGNWTNNGGNKLHLELSVIANKRADSTKISTAKWPFLLDRDLLSGIGLTAIESGKFQDVLYAGVELDVVTTSEISNTKEIINNEKEVFMHILSGSLLLQPENGETQTYYKGDFFILPKGFRGLWEVNGQRMLRLLKVIAK